MVRVCCTRPEVRTEESGSGVRRRLPYTENLPYTESTFTLHGKGTGHRNQTKGLVLPRLDTDKGKIKERTERRTLYK